MITVQWFDERALDQRKVAGYYQKLPFVQPWEERLIGVIRERLARYHHAGMEKAAEIALLLELSHAGLEYMDEVQKAFKNKVSVDPGRTYAVKTLNQEVRQRLKILMPQPATMFRAKLNRAIAEADKQRLLIKVPGVAATEKERRKFEHGRALAAPLKLVKWQKDPSKPPGAPSEQVLQTAEGQKHLAGRRYLGEHYLTEMLDPAHYPPHEVVGTDRFGQDVEASARLEEWRNKIKTDPSFTKSLFEYLDACVGGGNKRDPYAYLETEIGRKAYEVTINNDTLYRNGERLSTTRWELSSVPRNGKTYPPPNQIQQMDVDHGIWVISKDGKIYSGPQKGRSYMHHSGFLAGAPIMGGGEWFVRDGRLRVITGSSGHYNPTFAHFRNCLLLLQQKGVNLATVAAEWCYDKDDNFYWFNAKQVAVSGAEAGWLKWPTRTTPLGDKLLQPVDPFNPLQVTTFPVGMAVPNQYSAPTR